MVRPLIRFRPLVPLLLLLALTAEGGQWQRRVVRNLDALFFLPDSNLVSGSDTLRVGNRRLLPGEDYHLFPLSGRVEILRPRWLGREAVITYAVFPPLFPRTYRFLEPGEVPLLRSDTTRGVNLTDGPPVLPPVAQLNYQGSFMRGVSLGNNSGLDLQSGLRLQVDGSIGEEMQVSAFLTDQVSPLQPEGNTRNLEEVDRIYVELQAPRFTVTMGDFNLEYAGFQFLSLGRRVEGARAVWSPGSGKLGAVAASSRGHFRSQEISGRDGVQGPYLLSSEEGENYLLVIAGSEKVWLDGELLTRGAAHDYTIDYSSAEITFTSRRLITSRSRITVDFEYADQRYRRDIYLLNGSLDFHGQQWRVRYLAENDDRRHPLNLELTPEMQRQMAAAGDNVDSLYLTGVREVEPGRGNYRLVDPDTSRWGWYEFREDPFARDSVWRYEIRFSRLGRDEQGRPLGDYSREYSIYGYTKYVFRGPGGGEYAPVIPMSPPTGLQLLGTKMVNRWSRWEMSTELVASNYDRNTFSGNDDRDNSGAALDSRLNGVLWQGNGGRLRLDGRVRTESDAFHAPSRSEKVEFGRNWSLDGSVQPSLESEAGISWERDRWRTLRLSGGILQTRAGNASSRWEGDLTWEDSLRYGWRINWREARARYSRISTQDLGVRWPWRLPRLAPVDFQFRLSREMRQPDSLRREGFLRPELSAEIPLGDWETLTVGGMVERFLNGTTAADPLYLAQRYQVDFRPRRTTPVVLALNFTHYYKDFQHPDSSDLRTLVGQWHLDWRPRNGGRRLEWDYRLDRNLVSRLVTVYVPVDSGEVGDYSQDPLHPGRFVPDPYGNFRAYTRFTGDFLPSTLVTTDLRLSLGKPRGLSYRFNLRMEGKSTTTSPARLYLLLPAAFREDSLKSGLLESSQNLRWRRPGGEEWSLLWRTYWFRNGLQLLQQGDRMLNETEVKHRHPAFPRWNLEELLRGRDVRQEYTSLGSDEREHLQAVTTGVRLEWRPLPGLRWENGGELSLGRESAGNGPARAVTYRPVLEYRYSRRGNVRFRGEWTRVTADSSIPPDLFAGKRVGDNFLVTLGADYRYGRSTTLSANLDYRRLPGGKAVFQVSLQLQSFF